MKDLTYSRIVFLFDRLLAAYYASMWGLGDCALDWESLQLFLQEAAAARQD